MRRKVSQRQLKGRRTGQTQQQEQQQQQQHSHFNPFFLHFFKFQSSSTLFFLLFLLLFSSRSQLSEYIPSFFPPFSLSLFFIFLFLHQPLTINHQPIIRPTTLNHRTYHTPDIHSTLRQSSPVFLLPLHTFCLFPFWSILFVCYLQHPSLFLSFHPAFQRVTSHPST